MGEGVPQEGLHYGLIPAGGPNTFSLLLIDLRFVLWTGICGSRLGRGC